MKRFFALIPFLLALVLPARAVILEWDANTETNLAGYRVYSGRQSRVYDSVLDVGNQTLAQLTTQPGTTYYAVTAYDTDGLESDFSDEVFYTAPGLTLEGDYLTWQSDPLAVRYEILSGWSLTAMSEVQWIEPQYLRLRLLQNPARKYYALRSRYADGSVSEYSPVVSWPSPKVAAPRRLAYPLPAGRWLVESTFALRDPAAWIPFETVVGPVDFQIVIDTNLPERYFRARLMP